MSYYVPVVLYGCETWTHTLRKKCRLRVSENRVLRSIFWPKEDEVTQKWRRLHKEELYVLYSSPNIIWVIKSRRLRWAGHRGRGEVYTGILVGKPEEGRPLGKHRFKWEDNIKMGFREVR
jgi:hypothetical protein